MLASLPVVDVFKPGFMHLGAAHEAPGVSTLRLRKKLDLPSPSGLWLPHHPSLEQRRLGDQVATKASRYRQSGILISPLGRRSVPSPAPTRERTHH